MRISVAEAKDHLPELIQRAEAGDEVILTGNGQAAVRLVPESTAAEAVPKLEVSPEEFKRRMAILNRIQAEAKPTPGPSAARSQDFLYNEDGLPG
ncbi:antitoxin [Brucella endophytica]|uniref:Antitoxin n=1 Tax=Brucella endophytica TaxID=1963359 RepID=A0A916SNJ9_9HYPH|nr:type II toxin-antitoxin system prevent-host-death family antitoxin [Brucella endophytica]GGB05187.1 antitoxin [Brucella endophytica]